MRCGVWVAVALFAAACQPSSLGPAAPAQNVWVTADAAGHDAQPRDAAVRHDAAPLDAVRHDAAPVERGLPDAPAHDAATADGGTQTCGSLHLVCTPYLCDVDAGQCRSTCNGPADCTNGRACVNHTCQVDDLTACTTNSECLTDFCVDGVCCNSACAGACRTCTLPGAIGTCSQVPAGAVDPRQISCGRVVVQRQRRLLAVQLRPRPRLR